MTTELKQSWFYLICIAFALINLFAIALDFYWVGLLPVVLVFSFLILFKLDALLLLTSALIPLSVIFDDIGFGLGISLPDEPVIIMIMFFAIFKFLRDEQYDYRVFRHPITVFVLVYLVWMFITSCTSVYPLISFKFFLSRLWYVVVFYFLGVVLFKKFRNIRYYLWFYIVPLVCVVAFILAKHSIYNFSLARSYSIVEPFFVDHGVYAATVSFMIPIVFCFFLFYRKMGLNLLGMIASGVIGIIFLYGVYFSYTRAAWISLAGAACLLIPVILRIKFNTLLVIVFSTLALAYTFQNQIIYLMSKNQQKSANGFMNHLQSISNIKTDPSNTERINRWMSAISMFEDKPVLGFGPGTYSFCYAPFQQYRFHTVISTNFGDGGNSHNEYLNPLAEMGIMGLLSLLILIYFVFNTSFRLYYSAPKAKVRLFSLAIMLGIATYYIHGFMNNYSDTDKVGSLLWAGFGMLTAMDIYHNKQDEEA